jgi:hypothetical protein
MMFWKKQEKWHEVKWSHGRRRVYLALQFARNGEPVLPRVEHLPALPAGEDGDHADVPAAKAAAPVNGNGKLAEGQVVSEVKAAVDEYNRKNLLALRVSAIRYRAEHVSDHADMRAAATKLLNLLWKVDE